MSTALFCRPALMSRLLRLSALQRDVVRIIAFAAMVADHIASAFALSAPLLHLAGRCAFPLFALVCGLNFAGRPVQQHTINRLMLLACLAQPGFWLCFRDGGMQWWQMNILFTFAVALQAEHCFRRVTPGRCVMAVAAVTFYLPLSSASYGGAGILMLISALRLTDLKLPVQHLLIPGWLMLVALVNAHNGLVMATGGVVLTLAAVYLVQLAVPAEGHRLKAGRWFAPAYIVHLLLIAAVVYVLS